jgi:hypothetical protein
MHQCTSSDRVLIIFYLLILQIAKAKLMFHKFQKTSFQFQHCWNVLRCQPKWINDKVKSRKRLFAMTCSPSTPDSINIGENDIFTNDFVDSERPLGGKVENERLNKQNSKNSASVDVAGILNEINEEKKMELIGETFVQEQERLRILLEHEQERLRFKQEKLRAEQVRKDDKIMLMDTSGLSKVQKEYIQHRQMKIVESRRKK